MNNPEKKPDIPVTSMTPDTLSKIYPRHIDGVFQRLRTLTIWAMLSLYFAAPWITWDGRQAVLLDIPARKFYIFGLTFWPQDLFLLAFLLMIAAFGLFFFTVVAGRIWCGYTCPQTVWTRLFMWIERHTEGDRHQRVRLDKAQWTLAKVAQKLTKHALWLLVSFVTAITFVGYFIPIPTLFEHGFTFNLHPWASFWTAFFTIATYTNAGWLREQVCLYMCPYARFQSVMYDRDTLTVAYDPTRGEPRGHRKRKVEPASLGLGDCIDCTMCVQVCPTGIDIRQGLQYECIGCAACIDACDSIMDKMGYPRGLIRYSSENAIERQPARILRPRMIGYGLTLLLFLGAFAYFLLARVPLQLNVSKDRNPLYRETVTGMIQNTYTLKIANMSQQARSYNIEVSGLPGITLLGQAQIELAPGELTAIPIQVEVNPGDMPAMMNTIYFSATEISENTKPLSVTEPGRFIGPAN